MSPQEKVKDFVIGKEKKSTLNLETGRAVHWRRDSASCGGRVEAFAGKEGVFLRKDRYHYPAGGKGKKGEAK